MLLQAAQASKALISFGVILPAGLSSLRLSQLITAGVYGGLLPLSNLSMLASRRARSLVFIGLFCRRVAVALANLVSSLSRLTPIG